MLESSLLVTAVTRQNISDFSLAIVFVGAFVVFILLIVLYFVHYQAPKLQTPLFAAFALIVGSVFVALASSTLYFASSSPSGPIERKAAVNFFACGREMDLRDPERWLANKTGQPNFFEMNDGIIRYQGIPNDPTLDTTLTTFMDGVGGYLSAASFVIPLNEDEPFTDQAGIGTMSRFIITERDGIKGNFNSTLSCDGITPAVVQLFVKEFNSVTNTYEQRKIEQPHTYNIYDSGTARHLPCLIVEFDAQKERTEQHCRALATKGGRL